MDAGRSGIEIQAARGLLITQCLTRRFRGELGVGGREDGSVSWELVPEAVLQSQNLEDKRRYQD